MTHSSNTNFNAKHQHKRGKIANVEKTNNRTKTPVNNYAEQNQTVIPFNHFLPDNHTQRITAITLFRLQNSCTFTSLIAPNCKTYQTLPTKGETQQQQRQSKLFLS